MSSSDGKPIPAREHRCAYGNRCRDHVLVGGVKFGALIESQRGLCRRCFGMVRGAIGSIEGDYAKLNGAVGDHASSGEVHVSGTREPPMPLNGTVLALRSTLSEWAEAAMWAVAEPLGIDVRERHKAKGWPVKDGPVITQAGRILPENLKLLLDAPEQSVTVWVSTGFAIRDMDGIDIAMKLCDIHHEVNQVLGLTNPRIRLSLPCPKYDCGTHGTVGMDNGSTEITCTACGGAWSQAEYDWLSKLLITDEQEKETAMLKYLLAEARWKTAVGQWLVAERDHKLLQLGRLSRMSAADLAGIDGAAVVNLVREML